MSIISTTFGARLAEKRKAAGLTQDQLGEHLGVGKGAVSAWEVDRTQPSAAQLAMICARLMCSADELLGVHACANTGDYDRRKSAPAHATPEVEERRAA